MKSNLTAPFRLDIPPLFAAQYRNEGVAGVEKFRVIL